MQKESGSLLIFSSFLILSVSIILVSYWKLVEYRVRMLDLKKNEIRATYAAKSGIEDAIEDLKQNHDWEQGNLALNSQWIFVEGNTFYKSTTSASPLTHFSYPVTFSVTVSGNPDEDMFTIDSKSTIFDETTGRTYTKTAFAKVIKTFNEHFEIIDMKEESE
jgi:hypothetical protein